MMGLCRQHVCQCLVAMPECMYELNEVARVEHNAASERLLQAGARVRPTKVPLNDSLYVCTYVRIRIIWIYVYCIHIPLA